MKVTSVRKIVSHVVTTDCGVYSRYGPSLWEGGFVKIEDCSALEEAFQEFIQQDKEPTIVSLVAKYLAVDGSCGIYESVERERLAYRLRSIVGINQIEFYQSEIRKGHQ